MFVSYFGKARTETASRKKEKPEKNTCTPTLVTYSNNYSRGYGESRKTLQTGLEDACNQLPTFRFQQDSPDQRAGKEMELRRVRSSTIRQDAPGSEDRSKRILK